MKLITTNITETIWKEIFYKINSEIYTKELEDKIVHIVELPIEVIVWTVRGMGRPTYETN